MQYLGGKSKIRSYIADVINKETYSKNYIEPFVGGGWILQEIKGKHRTALDSNPFLITLYRELQKGWLPPDYLSLTDYNNLRYSGDTTDPLVAFAGFGCSFAGKWFGGYARSQGKSCYAATTKRSLLKQLPLIMDVDFKHALYKDLLPEGNIIYCDPPYKGTTQYDFCKGFNHEEFWNIMRKWAKSNKVYVSEYAAPDDFVCIMTVPSRMGLREGNIVNSLRTEKLFTYRG